MLGTLGTRKTRNDLDEKELGSQRPEDGSESTDYEALFRRHFESEFEPLPAICPTSRTPAKYQESGDDNDASETAWEGLSDEDEPVTELVQHDTTRKVMPEMTREEYKTFMTSKPPSLIKPPLSKTGKIVQDDPDAKTDAANIKKDLALQRLLKESHLLSPSGPSSDFSHSGINRHKALDMRLQDMGSKSTIFKQDKMPLAQRRGILAKAKAQEENRRKEAFENGVVLEKARAKKRSGGLRERGIGAPAVGRFQGGTLKLSKKDVAEIEGPREYSAGGKRKRR